MSKRKTTRTASEISKLPKDILAQTCPHILIIEDNAVNQTIMKRFIKVLSPTTQVTQVTDPTILFDEQEQLKPEYQQATLIILDFQMPGLTGNRVATHIRNTPTTQKTPIIAWSTGHPGPDYENFEALCNTSLAKPSTLPQLAAAITKAHKQTQPTHKDKASSATDIVLLPIRPTSTEIENTPPTSPHPTHRKMPRANSTNDIKKEPKAPQPTIPFAQRRCRSTSSRDANEQEGSFATRLTKLREEHPYSRIF